MEALTQSPEIFSFVFQVSVRIDRINTKQMEQLHFWLTGHVYHKKTISPRSLVLPQLPLETVYVGQLDFVLVLLS